MRSRTLTRGRFEKDATRRQILFVGEQPMRPGAYPFMPPQNGSAKHLAQMIGMDPHSFRLTFKFANVLPYGAWSVVAARAAARELMGWVDYTGCEAVVLMGRKVAEAFGYGTHSHTTYFEERRKKVGDHMVRVFVIPHPSRRNRLWNKFEVRVKARTLLRRLKRWALS